MRDEGDEPGSDGGREPAAAPPEQAAGPPQRSHTRRWFLAAAGAVLAGAGGGVAIAFTRRVVPPVPNRPPEVLVDAYAAELRLIASAAATARAEPTTSRVANQLRRDHQAHLAALRAQLSRFDQPTRAAQRRAAHGTGPPVATSASLADAERSAGEHAAARASQLARAEPTTATLLASIAACEAGHVLLLQ